jgi:hypothetical protein
MQVSESEAQVQQTATAKLNPRIALSLHIRRTRMKIPDWVQEVLSSFEDRTEPYNEVEIVDALNSVRKGQGDLNDADWKGLIAEWSAFLFGDRRNKDSVWGTYFAPMMSGRNASGLDLLSPDIKNLDADVVTHWEEQARVCRSPVMRARYSDLVWDLKRAITKDKPNPEYARIAIDSYLEAADKKFYPMQIVGIQWLGRALDLSRSINDPERTKGIVDFMFEFYDRVAQPNLVGMWIFLFDNLYGEKLTTPDQESRIIANLEAMLALTSDTKPSDTGVYLTLNPWGAEAAAQRLGQHYRRDNDKQNVDRVMLSYGKAFEQMARDAGPMMAMAWLQPVIERYEQEGMKAEAERLQVIAAEKGKNIASDLKTVSVNVEVKPEDVDKLIEHLVGSGDLKTSLGRVAGYFIPKANDVRKLLENLRADAPLQSMIPITMIEHDGFPTAKIGSIDEDADGRLHMQLGRTINFYQPFLEHALTKLREQYTPTVDDILDFLCQSPLFAENRTGLLKDGLSAYEQGDFIKAIHVLVPQVEHTLHTFLGRLGIPSRKTVRNQAGITDAKNMNEVLGDARMREKLTENLWRYLSVVYIDRRGGLNLRNDLAHGLVSRESFNKHVADLVFHTLLALSLMRTPKKSEGG